MELYGRLQRHVTARPDLDPLESGIDSGWLEGLDMEAPRRGLQMKQKLRKVLIALLILVWTLAGLQRMSIALERKEGFFRKPDAEAQSLANLAVADLTKRHGLTDVPVRVQSIERAEFPDASLGAPEPGVRYPRGTTLGYNIRLKVGNVVYRYWATGGRAVYVESYLPLPQEDTGSD
jgi:hypothetical protein